MKRLTITGNLGRDPELRVDANGNAFATFSVAVAVGNKNNPRTDWVDVSCSGRLAEIVTSFARKGNKVLVDGFPSVNAYINADNIAVSVQRLYAHNIEILNRGSEKNADPELIVASTDELHAGSPIHLDIETNTKVDL